MFKVLLKSGVPIIQNEKNMWKLEILQVKNAGKLIQLPL